MIHDQHHPPAWARKLLEFFCREDYADEIIGDIHEAYHWRLREKALLEAKVRFLYEVLMSLKPANLKTFYRISMHTMIFRNHLKVAFRALLKRRSTAFINIFGLAMGVSAFTLIFLYAYQVLSFDDHHIYKDRVFLIYKERVTPAGTQSTYDTWVPLKDRLKNDYSQVKEAARYYRTEARVLKHNKYLEEEIAYTDGALFGMFSFPLLHGDINNVFPDKHSVALGREMAMKYFNNLNPVGEALEMFLPEEDTTITFRVSAVMDELPENTSLKPGFLIPIESIPGYTAMADNWSGSFLETFVLLDKEESADYLEADFPGLVETLWNTETRKNTNFKLLPFEAYYDTFLGSKANARMLLFIGIGILLIAVINFMNLSTAQASQRAKEVGMRKVLGAFQGQLRAQFFAEALITAMLATFIGSIAVLFVIPYFNDFFSVSIAIGHFVLWQVILFVVLTTVVLGIVSGLYPALYLSSARTINVLKQAKGLRATPNFRNALVIVQFSIALFLIACTMVIKDQINFMSGKEMGFEPEGVLLIEGSMTDFTDLQNGRDRIAAFKDRLLNKSYVKEVALSSAVPTSWTGSFTFVVPAGWTGDPMRMRYTFVDANFFDTFGMSVKQGRNFLDDIEGEQGSAVILNEAAMKDLRFLPGEDNVIRIGRTPYQVVGVVEDFHFESLENEIAPTLFFYRSAESQAHSYISCKMDMSDINTRLVALENLWDELGATREFTFSFADDRVGHLYESEKRYLGLVTMFSIISIIVACLGLYGLTLFMIEKRRKEISIRKVLGAEIHTLLQLIFRDFMKWVVIAFVLSVPLAAYFMNDWLSTFHYRISVSWMTFITALLMVLGLVILTVGYQSLKAAYANPVQYLEEE